MLRISIPQLLGNFSECCLQFVLHSARNPPERQEMPRILWLLDWKCLHFHFRHIVSSGIEFLGKSFSHVVSRLYRIRGAGARFVLCLAYFMAEQICTQDI